MFQLWKEFYMSRGLEKQKFKRDMNINIYKLYDSIGNRF